MTKDSSVANVKRQSRIERKSSIESEPLTLTLEQIRFAREAAAYVSKTKTLEEALNIFTEGLEPVLSISRKHRGIIPVDLEGLPDECNQQCATFANIRTKSPFLSDLRDVATAPF